MEEIKMVKITFIIGIVLIALIFQKNPLLGIAVLGLYIWFRFRRRRFNSNQGLIESGEKNTYMTIEAMNMGFQTIADAIRGEDTDDYYDNDKNQMNLRKKTSIGTNIYRN